MGKPLVAVVDSDKSTPSLMPLTIRSFMDCSSLPEILFWIGCNASLKFT